MFLKTGSNGWRDSDDTWLFKTRNAKCILISINMTIAWTTETAKFRKLKKWQHFEVKISLSRVLFVFWVVKKKKEKENRRKHHILKSAVYAIKVHPAKISFKFQVNRSTKTWYIPSASLKNMDLRSFCCTKVFILTINRAVQKIKYYKIVII